MKPKPICEPGQGGAPYFRKLGEMDALDTDRKRMRKVPNNFKLAYIHGWYDARKAKNRSTMPQVEFLRADLCPDTG